MCKAASKKTVLTTPTKAPPLTATSPDTDKLSSKARGKKKLYSPVQDGKKFNSPINKEKKRSTTKEHVFFELQEREYDGKPTGNMCVHAKALYELNDEFKKAFEAVLLGESLSWLKPKKCFKANVHTPKQVRMLLTAMRSLDEDMAKDLPRDIDETKFKNQAKVAIVPVGNDITIQGNCYPFRVEFSNAGLTWDGDYQITPSQRVKAWVGKASDVDVQGLILMLDKWGWIVDEYDGIEGEEEE